jgi:type IV pilus assembly protein PilC
VAVYTFKARSLEGKVWKDTIEADSVEALEYTLNEKGYFILSAKERKENLSQFKLGERITKRDLAVFCRQLSVIINAGVTIIEAVDIISKQMSKRTFSEALTAVWEDVQKGKLLSQAMAAFPAIFPEFLRNMVRVGEASGTLDTIMMQMADYYENEDKINRKVKSAMTYPTILGVLTVGVVILLMVVVLPMFSGVLSEMGGQMPGITLALMAISDFMRNNILMILLILVVLIIALTAYGRTETGRFRYDTLRLRLPVIKTLTVKVITSRFARSMGILLRSGLNIINAMSIMSTLIGNRNVEERFLQSLDEVRQGRGIAYSLERVGIFPPLLIHMVTVGERTGELDEMLLRTSGFFDDEVEATITKMTTMIEPLMIIILAVIIAVILLSIFLPMLEIMNAVS